MRLRRPRVVDLYAAPELAVLAVLEAAVDVSLVAAHPDDHEFEDDPPLPERVAARALVVAARDVADPVNQYRLALARARERVRCTDPPS